MEHVTTLPYDPLLEEVILKALHEGACARALWERRYATEMTFDEFNFRQGLVRDIQEGRMIPERARECLRRYKQHEAQPVQVSQA